MSSQHRRCKGIFKTLLTLLWGVAQEWTFVEFSVPWDRNVVTKEVEKITNYSPAW